ncbi:MAG: chalcone isomerase family protein [Burkholderiaceae bacterium]|nr:chalcone isomerase family protein [Burkholderiaceae bacterium]
MNKGLAVLAIALGIGMGGVARAQPIELEGVKFEPTVQVGGQTLQLNGAGIRTRAIFKVYVAGLYVPQKSTDPNALLAQKGPRRVAIHMLRNVDAETFATSLADGLEEEQQLAAFKAQADALTANLKAIGEAKKGDAIFFEFTPEAGTRIVVNGQPRGNPIPGEDFFAAVLRIWLGNRPADSDLKKGMLGG